MHSGSTAGSSVYSQSSTVPQCGKLLWTWNEARSLYLHQCLTIRQTKVHQNTSHTCEALPGLAWFLILTAHKPVKQLWETMSLHPCQHFLCGGVSVAKFVFSGCVSITLCLTPVHLACYMFNNKGLF